MGVGGGAAVEFVEEEGDAVHASAPACVEIII